MNVSIRRPLAAVLLGIALLVAVLALAPRVNAQSSAPGPYPTGSITESLPPSSAPPTITIPPISTPATSTSASKPKPTPSKTRSTHSSTVPSYSIGTATSTSRASSHPSSLAHTGPVIMSVLLAGVALLGTGVGILLSARKRAH